MVLLWILIPAGEHAGSGRLLDRSDAMSAADIGRFPLGRSDAGSDHSTTLYKGK